MLVTITRQPKNSRQPAKTVEMKPYEKYVPYIPYVRQAYKKYQGYQGYKPYGHPDHPYKNKPVEDIDAGMSLKELLHKNRLALPEFTFVRVSGADKVTVEIDPHDVQSLLEVVAVKNLQYSMDDDDLPISCPVCHEDYTVEESKQGKCPRCKYLTCKVCGEGYNASASKRCPKCKDSIDDLPSII